MLGLSNLKGDGEHKGGWLHGFVLDAQRMRRMSLSNLAKCQGCCRQTLMSLPLMYHHFNSTDLLVGLALRRYMYQGELFILGWKSRVETMKMVMVGGTHEETDIRHMHLLPCSKASISAHVPCANTTNLHLQLTRVHCLYSSMPHSDKHFGVDDERTMPGKVI